MTDIMTRINIKLLANKALGCNPTYLYMGRSELDEYVNYLNNNYCSGCIINKDDVNKSYAYGLQVLTVDKESHLEVS